MDDAPQSVATNPKDPFSKLTSDDDDDDDVNVVDDVVDVGNTKHAFW